MYTQEVDGTLRGFAERLHSASPRRKGAAAFMNDFRLDQKAAAFQQEAKGFVGRRLLRGNPEDPPTARTQESLPPIKRYLEGSECAPSPIDQRYVVLAGWIAAVCRGCRAS